MVIQPPTKHKRRPLRIPSRVAGVLIVAWLIFGFASWSKSPNHFSRGKFGVLTRRMNERRSLSSHSASNGSARNPWSASCFVPGYS